VRRIHFYIIPLQGIISTENEQSSPVNLPNLFEHYTQFAQKSKEFAFYILCKQSYYLFVYSDCFLQKCAADLNAGISAADAPAPRFIPS